SIHNVQEEITGMNTAIRGIQHDMSGVAVATDRQSSTMAEVSATIVATMKHFHHSEGTISKNVLRLQDLMYTIDKLHRAIGGSKR
ncbi:MAG: hypothetical protein WAX89_04005, partial [Alphaproteobacteria bacterium]